MRILNHLIDGKTSLVQFLQMERNGFRAYASASRNHRFGQFILRALGDQVNEKLNLVFCDALGLRLLHLLNPVKLAPEVFYLLLLVGLFYLPLSFCLRKTPEFYPEFFGDLLLFLKLSLEALKLRSRIFKGRLKSLYLRLCLLNGALLIFRLRVTLKCRKLIAVWTGKTTQFGRLFARANHPVQTVEKVVSEAHTVASCEVKGNPKQRDVANQNRSPSAKAVLEATESEFEKAGLQLTKWAR